MCKWPGSVIASTLEVYIILLIKKVCPVSKKNMLSLTNSVIIKTKRVASSLFSNTTKVTTKRSFFLRNIRLAFKETDIRSKFLT